ncbi:MAG: hypothetical protein QNJ27_00715 [Simkaniaceae bacterium]|nr:hypothetical protein [Simkaniaceae bacterium]
MPPLEDVFLASCLRPKIDQIKQIGMLRKKYPKEAVVFKVALPLKEFSREDHSIDFYNGGMISKQNEVVKALEKVLSLVGRQYHHLLETFFHSLFPSEKRNF